ncbi:MAG: (Acyl-carrier-protein) S-malonyltransferase [Bacteriovoracaceae bacterium]|nr:(Acyl-carrier-protein) S-malonyltransferase [Bacteriovoracaceae bacterium]
MGYSLIQKFPDFESIFSETVREAEANLGFSLSHILKDGPAEKLKETEITQPALLTVSTAVGRWLKNKGIQAEIALGHSVGEYSALVYAEALSFAEAVKLVQIRGRLMQNAVPLGEAGMAALIGGNLESAQNLCKALKEETKLVLEVSLLNAPGQIVISGHQKALELAVTRGREFGIRKVVLLEVSGPFHCSLLSKAGEELGMALRKAAISRPTIPVISNLTARPEKTSNEIIENLIGQVSKPVLWEDSIKFAAQNGFNHFIEVGSGAVLTGLVKKILPEAKSESIENIQDLSALS